MEESDKTCAVCFTKMGDIAAEEISQQRNDEIAERENDDDWSDVSMSEEELYTEPKRLKGKEGISVGSECVQCGVVICHDCLVDWSVTTI